MITVCYVIINNDLQQWRLLKCVHILCIVGPCVGVQTKQLSKSCVVMLVSKYYDSSNPSSKCACIILQIPKTHRGILDFLVCNRDSYHFSDEETEP